MYDPKMFSSMMRERSRLHVYGLGLEKDLPPVKLWKKSGSSSHQKKSKDTQFLQRVEIRKIQLPKCGA